MHASPSPCNPEQDDHARHVLLIEDDRALRLSLAQTLDLAGTTVIPAASFVEAKDHIAADYPGVIVSDIRMP